MPRLQRSDLTGYGISILSVFAATLFTLALEPVFGGKAPLFFFTVAVILSSTYGFGPGLLATALGIGSVTLLFHEIFALVLAHSSLALFAVVGTGISAVMGRLQKTNAALLQTQQALQAANQRLSERGQVLERANEELQRFAYALAHDLNTPVRGICALTDMLVQRNATKLDESSRECAELIVNKALRMRAMINGLLDYAGAVDKPTGRTRVDAGAAVQKALQDLDSMIGGRGAKVTMDALPAVTAVESQLVQVFSNLISNGIKYCPRGRTPQIHISAQVQTDDCVFCVKDNGIGVDMQYAGVIFDMFKRLHGEEYEGSGIGLALCKTVIERHGGRIWVESSLGQGANFYFTLPKSCSIAEAETDDQYPISIKHFA